jgi:hypothetical protein
VPHSLNGGGAKVVVSRATGDVVPLPLPALLSQCCVVSCASPFPNQFDRKYPTQENFEGKAMAERAYVKGVMQCGRPPRMKVVCL